MHLKISSVKMSAIFSWPQCVKTTLVEVMVWCHQASHCYNELNQWLDTDICLNNEYKSFSSMIKIQQKCDFIAVNTGPYNSVRASEADMHWYPMKTLVQIMAWAIIWNNAGMLSVGPLVTNFSDFLIQIKKFSFKKMHLKMSPAKWRPFCSGLKVFIHRGLVAPQAIWGLSQHQLRPTLWLASHYLNQSWSIVNWTHSNKISVQSFVDENAVLKQGKSEGFDSCHRPSNLKLDSNRQFFRPCDREIWRMTLQNNRAPLLCYFKLCASFRSHWWIQTSITVRKRPIWVKFDDF